MYLLENQTRSTETFSYSDRKLAQSNLRNKAIERFSMLSESACENISHFFQRSGRIALTKEIIFYIKRSFEKAKRSTRWEGNIDEEDHVGIGFYNNEIIFFTLFFHEVGHNVLKMSGRSSSEYALNPQYEEKEEIFCWEFSKLLCNLLHLPFSEEVMSLQLRLRQIIQQLSPENDVAAQLLEEALNREEELIGYSSELGHYFVWQNDVPVLIESE